MITKLSAFVVILGFGRPLTSPSVKSISLDNDPCVT